MSLRAKSWTLGAIGLTVALLAGCGSPVGAPAATERSDAGAPWRIQQQGTEVAPGHGSQFLAKMGLTDGQKARLKEIKADWPKVDPAKMTAWTEQFKALVMAEPINQAALTNLLGIVLDEVNRMAAKKVALAEKARGVLTESQRQQAAVAVLAHVPADGTHDHGELNLTTEQRAAFAWTKEMTKARKLAALASFLLTGDQAALTAAWTVEGSGEKAAQMAQAIASMTTAQRTAMIAHMEKAHAAKAHQQATMD